MGDESNMATPGGQDSAQGAGAAREGGVDPVGGVAVSGAGNVPAEAAGQGGTGQDEPALLPPVDVIEDAGGITLYADLPGVPGKTCRSSSSATGSPSKAASCSTYRRKCSRTWRN